MKIKNKILAIILTVSLAVAPFSTISASEVNNTQNNPSAQMQEDVEAIIQKVASSVENLATTYEVTDTQVPVTTESSNVIYYDSDGKVVQTITPYYYTKTSQSSNFNAYEIKVPLYYEKDVIIPVKIKSKGALVYALAAEYEDNELSYYSLYSDAACENLISTNETIAYIPKAGTYYIKIPNIYLSEAGDSFIAAAFGFVSGANTQLKNKSDVVSAILNASIPLYYKVVVTKPTKLTFVIGADNAATVTLCNSKKKAITNETYFYSNDTEEGAVASYVVGKGTYYFKVASLQGIITTQAKFTTVKGASGTSKSKAGTLKVNGATKNILMLPGDTTKKNYYLKFYNPKRQKIYVNLTSSFSSGTMLFDLYDSAGKSFGVDYIYSGVDKEESFEVYVGDEYSERMLPKGTYYLKFKKVEKKTSGMIQVNITTW